MTGKPTKGPCVVKFRHDGSCYISIGNVAAGPHKQFDLPFERGDSGDEADAALICEAFNVYHETGLTPRQLAEQRAELLEAAKAAHEWIDMEGGESSKIYAQLSAIIAKAECVQ